MKDEVTYKLTDFLNKRQGFSEECEVVYVLVELRKLLEHYGADVPLLKFYSDWALHTKKERNKSIRDVAKSLLKDAIDEIRAKGLQPLAHSSPIIEFAHGDHFAMELQKFLLQHGLPASLTLDRDCWLSFVNLLIKVPEDQPIIKPCDGVEKIYFVPANVNCVILRIDFSQPVEGYSHYQYMNVLS
jgi:hypothetical protein